MIRLDIDTARRVAALMGASSAETLSEHELRATITNLATTRPDLTTRRGRIQHGRAIVTRAFPDVEREGFETRAADVIGDVLHAVASDGGAVSTVHERALRDYFAEEIQPLDEPLS